MNEPATLEQPSPFRNLPPVSKVLVLVVLAIILLASGFLRFHQLGTPALWGDEDLMYSTCTEPTWTILKRKWIIDESIREAPDPPLYLMISKAVQPKDHASLEKAAARFRFRFPAALFGLLAVLLMFWLGTALLGVRGGLISAALTGFFYHSIYYSREGRPYSLIFLLCALAALAFVKMVEKPKPLRCGLFALSLAAALYTHYFISFFVLVAFAWLIGLFLMLRKEQGAAFGRTFAKNTFLALVAAGLLYAPWIPAFFRAFEQGTRGVPHPVTGLANPIGADWVFFTELLTSWTVGKTTPFVLFALLIAGTVYLIRSNRVGALLLLPWLLLPLAILPWIPGSSLANFRHLIFAYPALILLLAAGAEGIYRWSGARRSKPLRNAVASLLVLAALLLLLLNSYRVLPGALYEKCFNDCTQPACIHFIDRCQTVNWWGANLQAP